MNVLKTIKDTWVISREVPNRKTLRDYLLCRRVQIVLIKLFGKGQNFLYYIYDGMNSLFPMKTGKIYCLIDPFTYEIRYVGFTTNTLTNRFSAHKHQAMKKNGTTYKDKWFRKCSEKGKIPFIYLLEDDIPMSKWEERENFYIARYKNLTNLKPGGSGIIVNRSIESVDASNQCRKKEIVQLTLDGVFVKKFGCIRDAERDLGFVRSSRIGLVCNNKAHSAYGYRWCFSEDYNNGNLPVFKTKEERYADRKNGMSKAIIAVNVFDLNDIKKYDSIVEFGKTVLPNNAKPGKLFVSKKTGLVLKKYKIIKI